MRLGRVFDDRTRKAVTSEVYRRSRDVRGGVFRVLLQIALLVSLLVLAVLLVDTVTDGWSVLTGRLGDFLSGGLRSQSGDPELGVFQGIRGSLWIAVFVIVLAFPLGIGAAIYLEEYAPKSRLTNFIDLNIRNLAGVPSVVYGLLGLAIFVRGLEDLTGGKSVTAAGITLAVLVLPIVIITSSEAIRAVPQSLREAGYGGRHPLGGHPHADPAVRGSGHPHRHPAVALACHRRGRTADPGRGGHRLLGRAVRTGGHHATAGTLHGHADPHHPLGSAIRAGRRLRPCRGGRDRGNAGSGAAAELSGDFPAEPLREEAMSPRIAGTEGVDR